MVRLRDKVQIEVVNAAASTTAGVYDNFTSLRISTDITAPSEAAFEIGDDGTFIDLEEAVLPGVQYRVFVNDNQIVTGRVELNEVPFDAANGSAIQFTVRSKLADAQYASADPKIRFKKTSIKDYILALYSPLGYTEADFVFDPSTARDLISGSDTSNKGTPTRVDLEPIKEDSAKVSPPSTIYAEADRHLRRHGLMHWDAPDGRIVVGAPNDEQPPIYFFRMFRGKDGVENNIISARRVQDYSGIPSTLGVYGVGGQRSFTKAKVSAVIGDDDVLRQGFYRPTMIIAEGIKTKELAQRAARRELSARSKRKDAFTITIDGLSFWDGTRNIPVAVDTTADIVADLAGGGLLGAYYVHRVELQRDAGNADTCIITVLKRGIWKL